jgi:hypothetical protein
LGKRHVFLSQWFHRLLLLVLHTKIAIGRVEMTDVAARLEALESRVGLLEDVNAIRRLHWAYGYYIDFNRADDVAELFAEDGEVIFLSGISRAGRRASALWHVVPQPVPGAGRGSAGLWFLLDHFQMQDIIRRARPADREGPVSWHAVWRQP